MENYNPIIISAQIAQGIISKASHIAGSITGYLITSGILIWGLNVYSIGDSITIFGISLTHQAFLVACMVWYVFDTYELLRGKPNEPENLER